MQGLVWDGAGRVWSCTRHGCIFWFVSGLKYERLTQCNQGLVWDGAGSVWSCTRHGTVRQWSVALVLLDQVRAPGRIFWFVCGTSQAMNWKTGGCLVLLDQVRAPGGGSRPADIPMFRFDTY